MRVANRRLEQAVLRALLKIRSLDRSEIVAIARSGAIRLGCAMPDAAQIAQAEAVAKGVPGVTSVQNALRITKEGL